jgi:hypothetical protein
VEINFYFSNEAKKRFTWEDRDTIEAMQEGEVSTRGLRNLAARFMVDSNNKYMDHKRAKAELGKLTEEESTAVLEKFMKALMETAVPNPSGSSSKLPSEPVTPISEPLTGSQP